MYLRYVYSATTARFVADESMYDTNRLTLRRSPFPLLGDVVRDRYGCHGPRADRHLQGGVGLNKLLTFDTKRAAAGPGCGGYSDLLEMRLLGWRNSKPARACHWSPRGEGVGRGSRVLSK